MAYLTHDEILLAYPFGPPHRLQVVHNPEWWSEINNHNLPEPVKIEFNENVRENMPENIHFGKGIYMFFLEPNHPFPAQVDIKHLLYVGRVQNGKTNFNFFQRFYKYIKAIGNRTVALNTMRLTNLWPEKTFVYYFDLSDRTDEEIKNIENNIYNKIVPPLNEALEGNARLTRKLY
ncbi:hypothetical protein [Dokdonia sp. LLG6352-1]|uniref:hypothetical protein n=1 Tax=Dokdonia sp. LLG6352-1 TaxID=3160831 RepID=UPI00386BB1CD